MKKRLQRLRMHRLKIGSNFRRKVLEVAKKELEESEYSEIALIMSRLRAGRAEKLQESVSL